MAGNRVSTTMRALLYDRPAQTLHLANSWPVPKPDFEKGEHLLKVDCTAMTNGELDWPFPPEAYKDYSPGVEMSGTVIACPADSKFPVGSSIYMRTTSPRSGSAREYTIGLESELAFRPFNLTAEQAAAVPVSALTAWQAFFVQAGYAPGFDEAQHLKEKKNVLIIGASGSVGVWATQIAHAAGYRVVGTCHARNTALVQSLGANEVIDYTKMSIHQYLKQTDSFGKFDLVLDCVGPNTVDAWHAAHPDHGLVLSVVPPQDMVFQWTLDPPNSIKSKAKGRFFIVNSDGSQLQQITKLIEADKVKPMVDTVANLDDYETAFDRFKSGNTTGKVILRVSSSAN